MNCLLFLISCYIYLFKRNDLNRLKNLSLSLNPSCSCHTIKIYLIFNLSNLSKPDTMTKYEFICVIIT